MRRVALALALGALAPASASAAPFGELPFQTVARGVSCVRATGMPGELVAWAPDGARVLRATPSGLSASTTVPLGRATGCPQAAAQPSGAGVIATPVEGGISVALREPGGGWGAPVTVALPAETQVSGLGVAVSERGDAVVAWREQRFSSDGEANFIRAVRRAPGGAPGAPETLATGAGGAASDSVVAGIGADGGAVVLWTQRTGDSLRSDTTATLVSSAAPGAGFAAPQRLGVTASTPALAVAPDGRALATLWDSAGVRVAERLPGGAFGPPRLVGGGGDEHGAVALALRPDGAALVAWGGALPGDPVELVRRSAGGDFGPSLQAAPRRELDVGGFVYSGGSFTYTGDGPPGLRPDDSGGGDLRAVLAPDGRALLTWADRLPDEAGESVDARAASVAPDGTAAVTALGGPLRDPGPVAPVLLDGGVLAASWGDNAPSATGSGRIHLAVEGAAAAAPAPFPAVRVGRPEKTVVASAKPLIVPVTCSAACDLRADLSTGAIAHASLTRAGSVRLRLGGRGGAPVAPRHGGIVRLRIQSGPPGATAIRTRTVRLRLRRPTPPPEPHVRGLTAVRDGNELVVRWGTDRSARGYTFSVFASRSSTFRSSTGSDVRGNAGTRYETRLRNASRLRYVRMRVQYDGATIRTRNVRVRR
jgi:hypothetical protein